MRLLLFLAICIFVSAYLRQRQTVMPIKEQTTESKIFDEICSTKGCGKYFTLSAPAPTGKYNSILINEYDKVSEFAIEALYNNIWAEIYRGDSIGENFMLRFDDLYHPLIRLHIIKSQSIPTIDKFAIGVY